jgi:RNA polymerase sigma-70 factor (ECF subfamily)
LIAEEALPDAPEALAVADWDRIVREHGPMVFATAWRILGHAADAEDVVQEVFLQVHQLHQAGPVRYWVGLLRRLATCRALDRLRQRRHTVPLDDAALASNSHTPDADLLEKELAERLRLAITQLPQREGAVFCMRYFEDLSYQQIAEALRIKAGAVATALHKARAKLEAFLLEPVPGE